MTAYRDRLNAGHYAPPGAIPEPEPVEAELAEEQVEPEPEREDLTMLTVEQLRSRLGGQGLHTSGTKAELIARLEEAGG